MTAINAHGEIEGLGLGCFTTSSGESLKGLGSPDVTFWVRMLLIVGTYTFDLGGGQVKIGFTRPSYNRPLSVRGDPHG